MTLLPYCVLLTNSLGKLPDKGVRGIGLNLMEGGQLSALFSEMERSEVDPDSFHQSALEFHNVVHALFAYAAVIPFRFPTWLSASELSQHLEKEGSRYQTFLTRHANDVQMELRLKLEIQSATKQSSRTGTEHLRVRAAQLHKIEETAGEYKQLLLNEVSEWHERDIPDGKRLFALVARDRVSAFRERLSGRSIRWSGPWPATEFLAE